MATKKQSKKSKKRRYRPNQDSSSTNALSEAFATADASTLAKNNNKSNPVGNTESPITAPTQSILTPDESTFYFLTPNYLVTVAYCTVDHSYRIIRHCRLSKQIVQPLHTFWFEGLSPSEHEVPLGASRVFAYLPWSNQLVLFIHNKVAFVVLNFDDDQEDTLLPPPTYLNVNLETENDLSILNKTFHWNTVTVDEEAGLLYVQSELGEQGGTETKQLLFILDPEEPSLVSYKTGGLEELRLGPALFMRLTTTESEGDPVERHLIIGIKEEVHLPKLSRKRSILETSNLTPSSNEPDSPLVSLVAITHLILVTPSIERTVSLVSRSDTESLNFQAAILVAPIGGITDNRVHLMTIQPSPSAYSPPQTPKFFRSGLRILNVTPGTKNPSLFTGFGHSGHYGPCSSWEDWREVHRCTEWPPFTPEEEESELAGAIDYRIVADANELWVIYRKGFKTGDGSVIYLSCFNWFSQSRFIGCDDDDVECQ